MNNQMAGDFDWEKASSVVDFVKDTGKAVADVVDAFDNDGGGGSGSTPSTPATTSPTVIQMPSGGQLNATAVMIPAAIVGGILLITMMGKKK